MNVVNEKDVIIWDQKFDQGTMERTYFFIKHWF